MNRQMPVGESSPPCENTPKMPNGPAEAAAADPVMSGPAPVGGPAPAGGLAPADGPAGGVSHAAAGSPAVNGGPESGACAPPSPASASPAPAMGGQPSPNAYAPESGSYVMASPAPPYGGAAAPPAPGGPGYWPACAPPPRPAAPFSATRADGLLVPAAALLGFLGVRLVLWSGFAGWGVAAFTGLFCAAVLVYARAKKVRPAGYSWFWLGILLLCGGSYALWPANLLGPAKGLLLCGAAVYWCGTLFGLPMLKKTSNLLPLDAVNMAFIIPFANVDTMGKSLAALRPAARGEKRTRRRLMLSVLAGLGLCVPLLAIVLPQLAAADSGNFGRLLDNLLIYFKDFWLWQLFQQEAVIILAQLILGLPLALWIFGYLAGGAHKRRTAYIDAKKSRQGMEGLQLVPRVTVLLVLFVAAAVYLVFVACQVPYFFSAFGGIRPEQYSLYSAYAREGFFELCRIAAINLGLLGLAALFCRGGGKAGLLKAANLVLCVLTLLLIATAFSKMGLYVARQGLTPRRLMTCVFMVFLAGVFAAVMLRQFIRFSVVRVAAVGGAALLCALCVCNLDGMVAEGNARRYREGSLEGFDEMLISLGGPAGAEAAMDVYRTLDGEADYEQKLRLSYALYLIRERVEWSEGTSRDDWASARARTAIFLPALDRKPADMTDAAWAALQKSREQDGAAWREWAWRQMEEAERLYVEYNSYASGYR